MRRWTACGCTVVVVSATVFAVSLGGCPITGGGGTGVGGAFNVAPTPIITSDVTRGVAPLKVSFSSDRSTDDGLIVAREWDFGDGSPKSPEIAPVHTFTTTGVFAVRLTLTDDGGLSATRTLNITVTEAPVPIIVTDSTVAPSAPATISFDGSGSFDPDGSIVQYQWDFGDGSREFVATTLHQYAAAGNYRAILTVTDNTGITASAEVLIQIGLPAPQIEVRVPAPTVTNMVLSQESPLWVQAIVTVDPAVNRFTTAGLDGDRDLCQAQSALIELNTGRITRTFERDARRVAANLDTPEVYLRDQITQAVFAPDGATIMTSSASGQARRHRIGDGFAISDFAGAGLLSTIAISPDGSRFAYGQSNGAVVLRDIVTGATIREFLGHSAGVNRLTFSPDGTQIFSGGNDRRAILWNVADGTILRDFVHPLAVNGVAFNPADPAIVATACEDAIVRVFNVTGGNTVVEITGHGDAVNDVRFSPNGAVLYSGGDDNATRSWDPATGAAGPALFDPSADVLSLAISPDGNTLVTGGGDGNVRVWNLTTRQLARTIKPCTSPVVSVQVSPDGQLVLAGIASRNEVQLDTFPGFAANGNDLNLSYPVPLGLQSVPAFGGRLDVPAGNYFTWMQVRTDRPDPIRPGKNVTARRYADCIVQVANDFTSDVQPATPILTLFDDRASIVVPPLPTPLDCSGAGTNCRQVMDLGPLNRGDRLFLSLLSTPGFGDYYQTNDAFSVMLLDADQRIAAWYQNDIFFSPDSKLVIGHNSARYYLVVDGGLSVNLRVLRNSGQFETRQQRVLVNFAGTDRAISVGGQRPQFVPPLDASVFNQFFAVSPNWGAFETQLLKDAIMATLRSRFTGYNVAFFSSDDGPTPAPGDEGIAPPFQTMHVGGDNLFLYGIADYIDPRNDTVTGTGITFAVAIGEGTIESPFVLNPVTDVPSLGVAIGQVAAHETGHLLGLRHTQNNPADIMTSGFDPTASVGFTISEVSQFEQIYGLPTIGLQDAPQLFLETVGGAGGALMMPPPTAARAAAAPAPAGGSHRPDWCGCNVHRRSTDH